MKAYTETKTGADGLIYSVRYLLDSAELQGLQKAGVIGQVAEIVGMQEVADTVVAGCELQMHTACGGLTQ